MTVAATDLAISKAIFALLDVPSVKAGATGGVWHPIAPITATPPYVTYARRGGDTTNTLGLSKRIDQYEFIVNATSLQDSSVALAVIGLVDAVLHGAAPVLETGICLAIMRTGTPPDREEHEGGVVTHVVSATYRADVQAG